MGPARGQTKMEFCKDSAICNFICNDLESTSKANKSGLTAKEWSVLQVPVNNMIATAFCRRALLGDGHVGPPQALQIQYEFCVVACYEKCYEEG